MDLLKYHYNYEEKIKNMDYIIVDRNEKYKFSRCFFIVNKDGNNDENRKKVLALKNNERCYQSFISQPKLLPAAEEYVIDRYAKLKEHFARILNE